MGKLFCCGGEGGELSEWEREGGGMGGGEGGANLHFLFLHQGRVFLILGGGGGLPFFPKTFIFIGIVLLNRDLNLGGN